MNQHDPETIQITVKTKRKPRLDIYLHEKFPWRSRASIQKLIRDQAVKINNAPGKPAARLARGDMITILTSESDTPSPPLQFQAGEIPVLYQDPFFIVLNKPSGILTHPVSGHLSDTLVNYVTQYCSTPSAPPRICHRLDRETSGSILMAFDPEARRDIQRQFEEKAIRKAYLAVVRGAFPEEKQVYDMPICAGFSLEDSLTGDDVKESLTEAVCIARGTEASLVRASPHTGRQNQIRIHLAAGGYPLIGDERFGGGKPAPTTDTFLLHSEKIEFYHPVEKLQAEIPAPLPAAFLTTLDYYQLKADAPERP